MRQRLVLVLVVLVVLVAGCGVFPHKAYEGPRRGEAELSVVKGGWYGDEQSPSSLIDLRVVDGKEQPRATYLASVLPGGHVIGLSERLRIGTRDRMQFCSLQLETAAGCTYTPAAPSTPSDAILGPWEWNVDMVVNAECITGGGFQLRALARCASSDKVFAKAVK